MAISRTEIRKHAEQTAYVKERSKLAVEDYVRSLRARDFLADPARMSAKITDDALYRISREIQLASNEARRWSTAVGMGDVTPREQREILRRLIPEWQAATEARVKGRLEEIQARVKRELGRGLSEENLAKAMKREPIVQNLRDSISSMLSGSARTLVNEVHIETRDLAIRKSGRRRGTQPKFTWIAVRDKKTCPDCIERNGKSRTMPHWMKEGLPGSIVLTCSSFGRRACRCQLIEDGTRAEELIQEVDVSKAVEKGIERAQDFAG